MFMRWQCRCRCESYVPQIAATPMKIIINEHGHFTLALAPSLASPIICVRSSNKEHVDQRNCSETIIIFWTNSFFVLLFRCCWLRCSTQCFVDVIFFFSFFFFCFFVFVFAVWAWGMMCFVRGLRNHVVDDLLLNFYSRFFNR